LELTVAMRASSLTCRGNCGSAVHGLPRAGRVTRASAGRLALACPQLGAGVRVSRWRVREGARRTAGCGARAPRPVHSRRLPNSLTGPFMRARATAAVARKNVERILSLASCERACATRAARRQARPLARRGEDDARAGVTARPVLVTACPSECMQGHGRATRERGPQPLTQPAQPLARPCQWRA